eukprot:scaffold17575_cov33-Tisochrysis_lutea.AAC.3
MPHGRLCCDDGQVQHPSEGIWGERVETTDGLLRRSTIGGSKADLECDRGSSGVDGYCHFFHLHF